MRPEEIIVRRGELYVLSGALWGETQKSVDNVCGLGDDLPVEVYDGGFAKRRDGLERWRGGSR